MSSITGRTNLTQEHKEDNWNNHSVTMPQDLPPSGGYEPVQYKVRRLLHNLQIRTPRLRIGRSYNPHELTFNGTSWANMRDTR